MILVTGGAGFIGANFVLDWLGADAASRSSTSTSSPTPATSATSPRCAATRATSSCAATSATARWSTRCSRSTGRARSCNFAAESHVDRSIDGPAAFVETNVVGTFTCSRRRAPTGPRCPTASAPAFRFLHVSTDEVYGSLGPDDPPFTETTPYAPNSPYSASKAASDHLVRAYHHTYGLPTLTTNCSNNYGPYQFPEKLIPLMIVNALAGKPLPVYGDGRNVRDWLYVGDHCAAIRAVLAGGRPGETYNVGGNAEMTQPRRRRHDLPRSSRELAPGRDYASLDHVRQGPPGPRPPLRDRRREDPPRARLDAARDRSTAGMRQTVRWYLDNGAWLAAVTSGEYQQVDRAQLRDGAA